MSSTSQFSHGLPGCITVSEFVTASNARSTSNLRKPFRYASTRTGTEWFAIMQYDSQPKYGMTGRNPTALYCSRNEFT